MNKFAIPHQRPISALENHAAYVGDGVRVLISGRIHPRPCRDCGGFETVAIRDGRTVVRVNCDCIGGGVA